MLAAFCDRTFLLLAPELTRAANVLILLVCLAIVQLWTLSATSNVKVRTGFPERPGRKSSGERWSLWFQSFSTSCILVMNMQAELPMPAPQDGRPVTQEDEEVSYVYIDLADLKGQLPPPGSQITLQARNQLHAL